MFACLPPPSACLFDSAEKYQVPSLLLRAIRVVENGKIGQVKANPGGRTFDYGPMQINTFWVNLFQRYFGIGPDQVASNECLNYDAAAFVVRYEMNRGKGDFWQGVAHYHSPDPRLGYQYVQKVYYAAQRISALGCG